MNVFLTILVVFLITRMLPWIISRMLPLSILIAHYSAAIVVSSIITALLAPIGAIVAAVIFFDLGGGSGAHQRQVVVEY